VSDRLGDWLSRIDLKDAVVFEPKRIERLLFGDLVLSASSYSAGAISYEGLDRVIFLVLDDGEQREGGEWVRVAPVDTDVENATSTDLVLRPSETELGISLRVLFAHQTVLNAWQLDESIGKLTARGLVVLRQAVGGELLDERFGVELEGPSDPRLIADRPTEELMRTLREPFFALGESVAEEASLAVAEDARAVDASFGGQLFELKWLPLKESQLAWAAKSDPTDKVLTAELTLPSLGEITALLRYDWMNDTLLFVIDDLQGFVSKKIELMVCGRRGKFETPAFKPERDREVVLVEKRGFSDKEVEQLAVRVS
jgi:hypothetical protein